MKILAKRSALRCVLTVLIAGFSLSSSFSQNSPVTAVAVSSSGYLTNAGSGGCTPTNVALVAGSGIAPCQGTSGQEYWLSFSAATQAVKITMSNFTFDGVIELLEDGTLISLACENATGNGIDEVLRFNALDEGSNYLIRFHALDGGGGNFSYCVEHYPKATIRDGWHPFPANDDQFPGYKVAQNTQRPWLGGLIQATKYYFTDIDSGDTYEHQVNGSTNLLNLNVLNLCYGITLSAYVEVQVDDYWCGISEERILQFEEQPFAQVNPSYFGATVTLGELIQGIYLGPQQQFEWRFTTDNGNTVIIESSAPGQSQLFFGQTSCLRYNRIYSVEVRASYCGVFGPWSEPTFITTPAVPYNSLRTQYCGEFLQPFSFIQCNFAPGATGYIWQLAPIEFNDASFTPIGPAIVSTISTNNTVLFLSSLGLTNGQSYRVAVKNIYADCNNFQQGDYGVFCQITIGANGVQARNSIEETIDLDDELTLLNDAAESLLVYPNPTTLSVLNIKLTDIKQSQLSIVEVHDISGRLIHTEQVFVAEGSSMFQLTLPNHLTPGSYFVSLQTEHKRFAESFVKQ